MANKLFQNVSLTGGLIAGGISAVAGLFQGGLFVLSTLYGNVLASVSFVFIGDFLANAFVKKPNLFVRALFPSVLNLTYFLVLANFGFKLQNFLVVAVLSYGIFAAALWAADWLSKR